MATNRLHPSTASPGVAEGIKWIQGAKVKDSSTLGVTIRDPNGLLEWLANPDSSGTGYRSGEFLRR